MAYEKQTWACEDIITADKLNHMEQGIADANDIKPYDFIITDDMNDSTPPQFYYGDYATIRNKLKALEPVTGIYVRTSPYGDVITQEKYDLVGLSTGTDSVSGTFSRLEVYESTAELHSAVIEMTANGVTVTSQHSRTV